MDFVVWLLYVSERNRKINSDLGKEEQACYVVIPVARM